jgi:hypothetical protein
VAEATRTPMAPMRDSRPYPSSVPILLGCVAFLVCPSGARASGSSDDITAVSSKACSDYVRTRLPDGSYAPELYSFGSGGHYGGPIDDPTIDPLKFIDVARVIAVPLADQKYLPARDPAKTKLLIMVYWGITYVPAAISSSAAYNNFSDIQNRIAQSQGMANAMAAASGSAKGGYHPANHDAGVSDAQMAEMSSALTMLSMVNEQRDQTDFATAKLLGYDSDDAVGTEFGNYIRGTALHARRDDLVSELEDNRYFVVLMAYDFQLLWKQKKHKLLWETRFSVRQRSHAFDKDLPGMARFASQYFGQNTHGLVRKRIPLGRVEIGNLESLGEVPGK